MRIAFKILYFGVFISVLNIGYSSVGFADDETVDFKTFGGTAVDYKFSEHPDDYIEYMGDGWYYVQSQGTQGAWIAPKSSVEASIPEHPDDYIEYMGDGWYYVQMQGTKGAWIPTQPLLQKELYGWIFKAPQKSTVQIDGVSKGKEVSVSKIVYPRVFVFQDIVYEDHLNPRYQLKMDVLMPATYQKMPVLVFISGGGFIRSDKTQNLQQRLRIAEKGYVVASVEYRTIPDAIYEDAVSDIKNAIRYLRANAHKFSIKEDKIAVMGASAGGYLAAMVGVTNGIPTFDKGDNLDYKSDVQGVIDIYGPTDLSLIPDGMPETLRKEIKDDLDLVTFSQQTFVKGIEFNGMVKKDPNAQIKANPLSYINKEANIPPFLLMHGDMDFLVSPSQTEMLYNKLKENGHDATRYILHGSEHNDFSWYQQDVIDIYIDFLDKNLK